MLAHRIIPLLLYRGTTLVKGRQFNSWRSIGHVVQAAEIYASRGVDEVCFLDIGATPEGRGPDFKLVEQITAKCFSPVTIGGGVRSVQDVRDLLNAGADKVCIRTNVHLIPEIADTVGRQAVVACVDYKRPWTGLDQARNCESFGAGEILLQCPDRDGMMCGYDLQTIKIVAEKISVPVIAAGGCGTPEDMLQAIQAGASAVAAGAMFAFSEVTPKDCARYLAEQGVEVRCS